MRLTLIRPPVYSSGLMGAQLVPVLGVACLAAAARAAGHTPDVVDMCGEALDRSEMAAPGVVAYGMAFSSLAGRLGPSPVIGISCMFSQDWVFHRALIRHVRRISPGSLIIIGGEHPTALARFCLEDCPELDGCVLGEGEAVLTALLDRLEQGLPLAGLPGYVGRSSLGASVAFDPAAPPERAPRIADLDSLPWPAWDLIPMEAYLSRQANYHLPRGRTVPMLASRGCPYACSFCSNASMWGPPWTPRDPADVAREMAAYVARYGAENFVFSDLTAVVRRQDVVELCRAIMDQGLNVTWQMPTLRTEALDREVMELMHRAGCREMDFAVESGCARVLESVGKKNQPERMAWLIRQGLPLGIGFSVNVIVGLPGESFADYLKTVGLVLRLAVSGLQEVNAFPFVPYPGSRLFGELLARGRIRLDDAYFMGLFAYADLGKPASWSERFGPRTLSAMRIGVMAAFYLTMFAARPARLVRLVRNALSGRQAASKLEGVLGRVVRNIKAASASKAAKAKGKAKEKDKVRDAG